MAEGRGCAARRAMMRLAVPLMGVLAGCAAGGPMVGATGPAPTGPAPTGMVLRATGGATVVASEWIPDTPRAVIVALHGYGDYGHSTFDAAAIAWAARGIATIAPDQRGFGRNPSRGRWPGADALVADAGAYVDQARARFPCRPVILLGHSMGGGIALAAAGREIAADGLILAAPAIWGGGRMNPLHRLAAWLAAAVFPDQRFSGDRVVRIQASDNIEMLRALGRDPLYLRPPSAREMMGLVRITDRAAEAAARTSLPALMLLGAKDQIVPNEIVREVFAGTATPGDVIEYPEGWHMLFRDKQAATVWADVARWVERREAPGCASRANP